MSERENLAKEKIKKSQEKYCNFANLAIQQFCDDVELDMNDINTMLYVCAKINNHSGKLILKSKVKRSEGRCRYLAK